MDKASRSKVGRRGDFEENTNHHSENGTGEKQKTRKSRAVRVCLGEVADPKSIVVNNVSACVILFSSTETLKCRHTKEK